MKKVRYTHIQILKLLLVFFLMTSSSAIAFDKKLQLFILPFQINAEKNMTFLEHGIYDMLVSRLSWKEKVIVIGKERVHKVRILRSPNSVGRKTRGKTRPKSRPQERNAGRAQPRAGVCVRCFR